MLRLSARALAAALVAPLCAALPMAQEPPAPAPEPAPELPSDPVVVRVEGFEIHQSAVEERFLAFVLERTGGSPVPPAQLAQLRERLHPQIVEEMIDEHLLDRDVERAEIALSDAEFLTALKRSFESELLRGDVRREEFAERVQSALGIGLDEFLVRQAADPAFRRAALQVRLLETRYPEESRVTDEEVQARYAADLATVYTRPETVRASHILIGTEDAAGDEERAELRARAESVLAECKQEGADFAELARKHSTGPSGPRGGDLGFFPREGAMVEPFAAAAFALAVGETSGIVETQFGYHVIRVTERCPERVIPLEESAASIREQLEFAKLTPVRRTHLEKLRGEAEIEYVQRRS